jgi:multidrug resistance protein, MATE family
MTRVRLRRWVAPGLRLAAAWVDAVRAIGGGWMRPRAERSVARSTMRELFELAWPIAAAMLGETAIGLVDTKLVGGLGAAALGGVGMATVLMWLFYSMVFGLMRGVKVRVAYAVGQGRGADAHRYAWAGVLFGACAGAVVWLLARDVSPVLRLLRVDPILIPAARDFLAARTYGAVASCVLAALIQHRQGIGDSRTPMLVGLGGNAFNAVLAYGLIYGRFGLPALGVRGAGYGTSVTEALEVTVMLALLLRERRTAVDVLPFRRALREVAGLGFPTGLHFGLESLAFTTFSAVLANVGAAEIAAHQIAFNTLRASFLPGIAVAEAGSVLVARALSRRNLREADRVTLASITLGAGFMSLCGLCFGVFGSAIARVFSPDPEVVAIARRLLLLAAVFQTLDAVNMVLRCALRGAKDVRWVAVVGTTVAWCCIPGAAFVLGRYAGWGAVGGWCGFILETSIGASLMWWRWSRGSWRKAFAGGEEPAREEALDLGSVAEIAG